MSIRVEPFRITIPEAELDDLRLRLQMTRWPDEVEGAGWRYGANLAYMKELAEYWRTEFDWRAQERHLNSFANFKAEVDGAALHFIHERGKGPRPLPILIAHGWPSSFAEMLKLIPLLTDPASHGGKAEDAFDVVVPSVPGYGFSERPSKPGATRWQAAEQLTRLMQGLGYARFGMQANDIGAVISAWIALDHPEAVVGLLTSQPSFPDPDFGPGSKPMTEAEKQHAAMTDAWWLDEGGYDLQQRTRPQTLAYGLNDSPAGLMAWIVEKWRAWTDPQGDIEKYFSKDELLTNVMIYWVTQTANSAARSYFERVHDARKLKPEDRVRVPTGIALTTEVVELVPREWAERRYADIRRWTEFSKGGHFIAEEEPELLAEEMREFFRPLRD